MDFRFEALPLDQIDSSNRFFRITTPQDKPPIDQSIHRLGLINPVVVKRRRDHFVVISGFRRIDACRRNAWQKIPSRVLPPDTPDRVCAELAIADNLTQHPLNFVEQARCFQLLKASTTGINDIRAAAEALGLGFNTALISKLEEVSAAPETIQSGLVSGHLSLPIVKEFSCLSRDDAGHLALLFKKMPMGLNKQREILQNLKEIAAREDRTVSDLLEEEPLAAIINDDSLDGNQKVNSLRAYLRKRRYPRMVAVEEKFYACVRNLGLGGEIQVSPPPGFENSNCTMTIRINNLDSLKRASRKIAHAVEHPSINQLFE